MPHIFGMGVLNLEGNYPITYCGQEAGMEKKKKMGLFYFIRCRCQLPDSKIYTISLVQNTITKNLGICVPYANAFGLDVRICAKEAGEGSPHFFLNEKQTEVLIPLRLPFDHISDLPNGKLIRQNGTAVLVITTAPEKQGSDQIP